MDICIDGQHHKDSCLTPNDKHVWRSYQYFFDGVSVA